MGGRGHAYEKADFQNFACFCFNIFKMFFFFSLVSVLTFLRCFFFSQNVTSGQDKLRCLYWYQNHIFVCWKKKETDERKILWVSLWEGVWNNWLVMFWEMQKYNINYVGQYTKNWFNNFWMTWKNTTFMHIIMHSTQNWKSIKNFRNKHLLWLCFCFWHHTNDRITNYSTTPLQLVDYCIFSVSNLLA